MIDDEFDDDYENEDTEEIEAGGFSIIDANDLTAGDIKRVQEEADKEFEPATATPIPENELTVIIDACPLFDLPPNGTVLRLELTESEGNVYYGDYRIGSLKPAILPKLIKERSGQYATVKVHSNTGLIMIKLFFSKDSEKGAVLIK